jgi:hypothetical protein
MRDGNSLKSGRMAGGGDASGVGSEGNLNRGKQRTGESTGMPGAIARGLGSGGTAGVARELGGMTGGGTREREDKGGDWDAGGHGNRWSGKRRGATGGDWGTRGQRGKWDWEATRTVGGPGPDASGGDGGPGRRRASLWRTLGLARGFGRGRGIEGDGE